MTRFRALRLSGVMLVAATTGCIHVPIAPLAPGPAPNFIPLEPDCSRLIPPGATLGTATTAFVYSVDRFDANRLTPLAVVTAANAAGTDEAPGASETETHWSGAARKTRWDIDLGLTAPVGDVYVPVLIKVRSRNRRIAVRADAFAVTAKDVNATRMFCDLQHVADGVVFKAVYYNAGTPQTVGSISIGIHVQDRWDPEYNTAVFIDPNIKNNGARYL